MPRYIIEQDIIDRYGEEFHIFNSDKDGDEVPDANPVSTAILDAEAFVDSYLGLAYNLPLPGTEDANDPSNNTVPGVLVPVVVDIAIYRLASQHDILTEEKEKRYKAACEWLMQASKRDVSLGIDDDPTPRGGGVIRYGPDRIFTRDKLKGVY